MRNIVGSPIFHVDVVINLNVNEVTRHKCGKKNGFHFYLVSVSHSIACEYTIRWCFLVVMVSAGTGRFRWSQQLLAKNLTGALLYY